MRKNFVYIDYIVKNPYNQYEESILSFITRMKDISRVDSKHFVFYHPNERHFPAKLKK
ncbi:hypothetical protein B4096_3792 [Heyndrickxia coagulans]|uniref:Uncharacterized protein n=1 Tax=Heyndrickxia coagulans TaxID=1398 RepID=A0A150K924_HEYCO|nr:hypothetical protein B4098_1684 [Heyndrickxia coagulans]KYC68762.1 hypothetical protein B4096_3792 [Heyndrickxia coagulans]